MAKQYLRGLGAILAISCLAMPTNSALAETKSLNFTLSAEESQSFASLKEQAEILAVDVIQQRFQDNPQLMEIVVTIVGDRKAQQVPILQIKVTRSQWQQQPEIKLWSRYFPGSATLLGYLNPQITTPTVNTTPTRRQRIENDPAFRDD